MLLLACGWISCCRAVDTRPNIVLFIADDLGYGEVNQQDASVGFPYNPLSANPTVAARPADVERTMVTALGTRALYSYSPSSECAPSRASIIIGRHVGTISVRGNGGSGIDLNILEPGFVVALNNAGYDTAGTPLCHQCAPHIH